MKRVLLVLALLAACDGEERKDAECTVLDEGDGTATITCPVGPPVRVPLGNVDVACTMTALPEGGSRIYCSNGMEIVIGPDGVVQFPGGGSIGGQAYLLGEQGRAGIRVTAGPVSTMTDKTGEFLLEGLPAGIYEVVVEYDGYAPQRLINVPAVGRIWRIEEPIVLYPGHLLTPVNPDIVLMSPTEDTLLVHTLRSTGVGPLFWYELDSLDGNLVSADARAVGDGSFRADGEAVVFVEHREPEGGIAIVRFRDRVIGDVNPERKGVSGARFFGNQVLLVGTEDGPGQGTFLWDPSTGAEVRVTDVSVKLANLLPVLDGETLIYQLADEAGLLTSWLWRRTPRTGEPNPAPFGVGNPKVAGGGAAAVTAEGDLVGIHGTGPVHSFNQSGIAEQEVFIAPDGRTCVTTTPPGVRMWDLVDPKNSQPAVGATAGVLFSPDGASAFYATQLNDVGTVIRLDLRVFLHSGLGGPTLIGQHAFGNAGEFLVEDAGAVWFWAPGEGLATKLIDGTVSSWRFEPVHRRVAYTIVDELPLFLHEIDAPEAQRRSVLDENGTPGRFRISELGIAYERAEIIDPDTMSPKSPAEMWMSSFEPRVAPLRIGDAATYPFDDGNAPVFLPGGAGFYLFNSGGTFFADVRPVKHRFFKIEDAQVDVKAVTSSMIVYEITAGAVRNGIFVMYVK